MRPRAKQLLAIDANDKSADGARSVDFTLRNCANFINDHSILATITVLPKLNVETLESMGTMIKSKAQNQSLFGGSMMALNNTNDDDSESSNEKAPTIESKSKNGLFDDLLCREVGFIMLQLVNGLKMLQAKGVEDMPLSLSNIIMCRELEKETQARLCILQG